MDTHNIDHEDGFRKPFAKSNDTASAAPDFVTIATARDRDWLTKQWHRNADGRLECEDFSGAYRFDFKQVPISGPVDLQHLIAGLGPNQCLLLGKIRDGVNPINARRSLKGEKPTLEDAAHHWLPFDVDTIEAVDEQGKFDPLTDPERTVRCVVAKLPPELAGAKCIWQFTSGAGMKPGVRMRLFFWLSRPLTGAESKAWLKGYPIDTAIYTPNQPIYAAAPIFGPGVTDPVAQRLGRAGSSPVVTPPAVIDTSRSNRRLYAEGVEEDAPCVIARAEAYLRGTPVNPVGAGLNNQIYNLAARLGDFGLSEDRTVEMVADWCGNADRADETARRGHANRENALGCDYDPNWREAGRRSNDDSADPADDGGPQLVNSDKLDNHRVTVEPVSYGGEMPEPPPVEELIPRWIEKRIMNYDEGSGGLGKSYIAQQESACVAAGYPVLGAPVEQCDVFYLNYEEPQVEFERRLHRIRKVYSTRYMPDGRTVDEWRRECLAARVSPLQSDYDRSTVRLLETSRLHVWHLRNEAGAHLLRVSRSGQIVVTRFGRQFLERLARRRDDGLHTKVTFDGLMDAIVFEGGTRSEDDVARQLLALLDRWCVEYDFTGRGILHPSRAGERTETDSYAPAWTTKPRALNVYKRVDGLTGKAPKADTPAQYICTRRTARKRSHGDWGYYVDMSYDQGIFKNNALPGHASRGGGEDAIDVAVDLALGYADRGELINRRLQTIDGVALSNQHVVIGEYRQRTGNAKLGMNHFLGSLEAAEKDGRLEYRTGRGHTKAGYVRPMPFPDDREDEAEPEEVW